MESTTTSIQAQAALVSYDTDSYGDLTYNTDSVRCSECDNMVEQSQAERITTVPIYYPEEWENTDSPKTFCANGHLIDVKVEGWVENIQLGLAPLREPLREFHCFMELPPELRRQIWMLNFPEPRILRQFSELDGYNNKLYNFVKPIDYIKLPKKWSADPKLTWLNLQLICREALEIFKDSYIKIELKGSSISKLWDEAAMDEPSDFGGMTTIIPDYDFFDKFRDTLYLQKAENGIPELRDLNAWIDISQVRRLAVDHIEWYEASWEQISECHSLKALTLVFPPELSYDFDDSSYHLFSLQSLSNAWLAHHTNRRLSLRENKPGEIQRELTRVVRGSKRWIQEFLDVKPSGIQKHAQCNPTMAVLGELWPEPPTEKIQWIVPKNKKAYGACFFTKEFDTNPHRYYMRLGHAECDIECYSDGSFADPVDGLERLFEEQEL